MSTRPRILVLAMYYLPAFKAGGPVRSLAGMISHLGSTFDFFVVASDRDLGDSQPFEGISRNSWNYLENAAVKYMDGGKISVRELSRIYNEVNPDIVYLCGGFSPIALKFLTIRRLGLLPASGVIMAPQGVFARSALQFKPFKKTAFMRIANWMGLYGHLSWHVTSEAEQSDLASTLQQLGAKALNVLNAPQFFVQRSSTPTLQPGGRRNEIRIAFISRICRVKNLLGALDILSGVRSAVEFNIYGPIEDNEYWTECQSVIKSLPTNIHVIYNGPISHDDVYETLRQADLFLFPSFGENFGHIILESMQSGCPVLISDKTAFLNLQAHGAGWDLPLADTQRFREVIDSFATMDVQARTELCKTTRDYAQSLTPSDEIKHRFEDFFQKASRFSSPPAADAA